MILRTAFHLFAMLLLPASVAAQELRLPGNAAETYRDTVQVDSYAFAAGPWAVGVVPTITAEGVVTKTAWRVAAQGITTLQILRPLRDQLAAAGFDTIFDCAAIVCGGFDFRFAIDVLPPPDMQVDLGDFRYLVAEKTGPDGKVSIGLLISRTARAGYVQIVQVAPTNAAPAVAARSGATLRAAPAPSTAAPESLEAALDQVGRTVLSDLTFETGSATLADGSYASLQELADFLADSPDLTVALVGHTDSSGSLDGNIALSKRRAGSVLERLVSDYNVPRRQLEAQGMGYLSPVANNRTDTGREANRRVEVIVTSTQ